MDRPEYRWLVAHCTARGGMRSANLFSALDEARRHIEWLESLQYDELRIYLIDLHELTPVAVTGRDG